MSIRPVGLVVFLGDLTDAKHANKQGSMQHQDEWLEYNKILKETGITEKTVWLDVRGNHGNIK